MTNARIHRLTLTNFRSYRYANIEIGAGILTTGYAAGRIAELAQGGRIALVTNQSGVTLARGVGEIELQTE